MLVGSRQQYCAVESGEHKVSELLQQAREKRLGYASGITAVLIWTGFILASRQGGISALSANDVIAIRYVTCAVILLPFWLFKFRFSLRNWRLWVIGLVGGLAYALCAFRGFQLAPASHAAVLLPGALPVLTLLLAALVNREAHPYPKWLGVGLMTLGIMSLAWAEMAMNSQPGPGHFWFLSAAFFWALFSVLVKRWHITPWQATVSLAMVTSVFYLPVYLLWLPKSIALASWQDIGLQAVYQGILATIIQMLCYITAVRYIGPAAMGSLMALVPITAGLLAIWVFDEALTTWLVLAIALVSIGSWVAQQNSLRRKSRSKKRSAEACLSST